MSTIISLFQPQEPHTSGQGDWCQQRQQADSQDCHLHYSQEGAPQQLPCFRSWPAPEQCELGMEGLTPEVEGPCLPKCPGNEVWVWNV